LPTVLQDIFPVRFAPDRARIADLLRFFWCATDIDAAVAPHAFLREVAAVGAFPRADRRGVYCAALSPIGSSAVSKRRNLFLPIMSSPALIMTVTS
jgi:hypothetical protein